MSQHHQQRRPNGTTTTTARDTHHSNSFLNSFRTKMNTNTNNNNGGNGSRSRSSISSSSSSRNNNNNNMVGTERIAELAYQSNAKLYQYPKSGFITKIESSSLLYQMMNHPEIYPVAVIYDMIRKEDYKPYIYINHTNHNNSSNDDWGTTSTDSRSTTTSATAAASVCPPCSYAQLTALLALAAEKWPPPPTSTSSSDNGMTTTTTTDTTRRNRTDEGSRTTTTGNYYDNDNDDDGDEYEQSVRRRREQQHQEQTTNNNNTNINIVQTLCQVLIQCIIRHCEEYQLDRQTEISELFLPFQKVTSDKATRNTLLSVLPAYMGLTATILSGGNPIPFYIGYAVSINAISQQDHQLQNFQNVAATTQRMSHIETTNLLHDTDYYDDENDNNSEDTDHKY